MRSTNESVPWEGHRTTTGAVLTEPAEYKDRIVRSKLRVIGDSATHIPGYLPRRQEPYQSPKMHTYRGTPEAFGRSVTICTYLFFFVVFPVRSDAPGRRYRRQNPLPAGGYAQTGCRTGFSVFPACTGRHRVRIDHLRGHGIPPGFGPAVESTGVRARHAPRPRHLGGDGIGWCVTPADWTPCKLPISTLSEISARCFTGSRWGHCPTGGTFSCVFALASLPFPSNRSSAHADGSMSCKKEACWSFSSHWTGPRNGRRGSK